MRIGQALPFARFQDRLLTWIGTDPDTRTATVKGMMVRSIPANTAYWLQLLVSVGIATMGLVLGSSAVIIGAMLVAPLMTPILGLAMGLAVGSPVLVLRSASRVAASMAVVIGGAAIITLMLPYH